MVARGDRIYPKLAQRKGIEGRVEVAIDTDEQGNVTDVRLTRSSGNSELDEKHLRLVWQWKLKPTPGGRQGFPILKCLLLSRGIKVRNLIVSISNSPPYS